MKTKSPQGLTPLPSVTTNVLMHDGAAIYNARVRHREAA
jgi:hypothetical protein